MDRRTPAQGRDSLTERERTLLTLITEGLSNDAIAERLALSSHTVKWHVKQIFSKLGVKRRTQAAAAARAFGLLDGATPVSQLRTTLPIPPTVLVGRQTELTQTLDLLSSAETRLLTILGPGGIGKTRLALAAGALWEGRSLAVHFVPLEGIQSVEHLIPAIAEALGLQFRGQVEPRLQVLAHLRSRALLLILDSCEHLLEAVPFFAEMLETCAGVKILATSRERLNLRGETALPLSGLPYPQDLQDEQKSDAADLFLQTARRSDLDFEPDGEDLRHIRRICQMVEGMPLAIELAAGWINALSPAQIVREIDASPAILETPARDAPPRHRSMEAVFAHSWALLTEEEREVFQKLSVFRGGFDRAAAEQVAGATLSTLKSLIDKSFVRPVGQDRYGVHELLRQFGAERLAADAEDQRENRIGHARYYLGGLYERRRELEDANFPAVISELRADMDNIWAAWRTGGEQGLALEIAQATRSFTILHTTAGLVPNLVQEIEYILPYLRAQAQLPFVNLALAGILTMLSPAYVGHLPEKSLQLVEEAAVHLDRLENPPDADLAVHYTFRATALMALDQVELAVDELQTAVAMCHHIRDDTILVWASLNLAVALVDLERYQQAHTILGEAAVGSLVFYFRAGVLAVLALIATGLGDYDQARHMILESVKVHRSYLHAVSFDLFLLAVATFLHHIGSFEPALEMVYLYFHPVMLNLFLRRKARILLDELEARLSPETRHSLSQRADDWPSETPSPENSLGLRPGFLDYVTQQVQPPAQA